MHVKAYDRWLLVVTLILVVFGSLMIYSSTSVITPTLERKNVSEFYYLKKHIFTVVLGLVAMYAAFCVRPSLIRKMAVPLLVFSFVLLVLVFVPGIGVKAGGAKRWIRLWPSTFQPSELVKLAMVIFLARYMSMEGYRTDRFMHFVVPVGVMGVFSIVFMRQPDFGATMSLGVLTLSMLFLSGTRLRYLLYLITLISPVIVKLAMEPYRWERLIVFLNPWKYPTTSGFQLVQSFIAFGSGGLTGVGLGKSRQKLDFLPEVHTDFIFSMVGEELGFLVAAAVVALFSFIVVRGVRIASGTTDKFSYYLGFGLSMMLGFQALVNFGVVTGLLPTKGLPLPFLSYGGSALLINMAAVGILLNLSRPWEENIEGRDEISELMRRKKAKRAVYGGVR
jgi:cell division protein FtsW